MSPRERILVGMSGGVDSSLSAALLVEQGYDVIGGFIKNWSDTKDLWTGECHWRGERRDALRVAAALGIPLYTFDFEQTYRAKVLEHMFAAYAAGMTPNPDVLCNQEIKFGLFFEEAMKMGCDGMATGHYARVRRDEDGCTQLLKGVDPEKDQSYFLHRVSARALAKTMFPIGHLTKTQVREEAERRHLSTAHKPDSQGICFVGKLDMHDFLRQRIPASPGEIVDPDGVVLGHHDGLDAYTIGQRQGLMLHQGQHAWYVAAKDQVHRRLIVVPDREHPLLFSHEATVSRVHWLASNHAVGALVGDKQVIEVMVRYRQRPISAEIMGGPDRYRILFREPVWAVAPGQSAVFYQGEACLGGGVLVDPDPSGG